MSSINIRHPLYYFQKIKNNFDDIITSGPDKNKIQDDINIKLSISVNPDYINEKKDVGIQQSTGSIIRSNSYPIIGNNLDKHFFILKKLLALNIKYILLNKTQYYPSTNNIKYDDISDTTKELINKIRENYADNSLYLEKITLETADQIIINFLSQNIIKYANNIVQPPTKISKIQPRNIIYKGHDIYDKYEKYILSKSKITDEYRDIYYTKNINDEKEYQIKVNDGNNMCHTIKEDLLKLFIERANINQKDNVGNSPIVYAIDSQNTYIIEKLKQAGAETTNPKIQNYYGYTPFDHMMKLIKFDNIENYDRFTKKSINDVILAMSVNKNYNKYMPQFFDISGNILLYLYNGMFYLATYNNKHNWSNSDNIHINELLQKYNILTADQISINNLPFFESIDNNFIKKNATSSQIINDKNIPYELPDSEQISDDVTEDFKLIYNKSIVNNYELLFENNFSKNTKKGFPYYDLFNAIWKEFLKKNSTIINYKSNIDKLQNKILKENLKENIEDFNIIHKLNREIFVKLLESYESLPQQYDSSNTILDERIDIITFVVRYIIFSQLYKTIIKMLLDHLIKIDKYDKTTSAEDYMENKINVLNDIIKGVNENYPIQKYIVDILPEVLVKQILQIPHAKSNNRFYRQSISDLFNNLTDILISNNIILISNTDNIITELNNTIIPYYKDLVIKTVPKYDEILKSFDNYILNNFSKINTLNILL